MIRIYSGTSDLRASRMQMVDSLQYNDAHILLDQTPNRIRFCTLYVAFLFAFASLHSWSVVSESCFFLFFPSRMTWWETQNGGVVLVPFLAMQPVCKNDVYPWNIFCQKEKKIRFPLPCMLPLRTWITFKIKTTHSWFGFCNNVHTNVRSKL